MDDSGTRTDYGPVTGLNQYITTNGAVEFYHDENFNVALHNGWFYDYDAENRLTRVRTWDGTVPLENIYDGLGRCVKRSGYYWGSGVMVTTYDGWKPIIEWDGSGNLHAWNIYGPGADEILWRYQTDVGHMRYHHDKQGSVTALLDWWGHVVEKYRYDAFGRPIVADPWDTNWLYTRTWSNYGNRFMFTGREWYPHLWLYDYRNRWYDPGVGRFLQTDPLGLQTEGQKLTADQKALYGAGAPEAFASSEMNLFRYCGDDAVNKSDPLGLYVPEPRGFNPEQTERVKQEIQKIGETNGYKEKFEEWAKDKERRYIEPAKSKDNWKGHYKWNSFIADIERASKSWWGFDHRGGTVYYDPDNWKTSDGDTRKPVYGLGHEIGHMIDASNGTYGKDGYAPGENRARWFENQLRSEDDQRPYL